MKGRRLMAAFLSAALAFSVMTSSVYAGDLAGDSEWTSQAQIAESAAVEETEKEEALPPVEEPAKEEAGETASEQEDAVVKEDQADQAAVQEGVALQDEASNRVITINYVFENGEQAAQTWSASLGNGTSYANTVPYPKVVGYDAEIPNIPYEGVTADENGITFNLTMSQDIEINVVYKPAMVNYTVKYYQQNVNDDNYTLADTETKQGLTGSKVDVTYAGTKDKYNGFYGLRFDESATVAADGSTEVEIYYDRNYYLMKFDLGGGYGVEPIYARYGAEISAGTPKRAGYAFTGWDRTIPATMPAANETYTARWNAETVNFTVVFWYENPNDDGYSYAGSLIDDARAGTSVNSADYRSSSFSGRDTAHFTYNSGKAETQTVLGDGSTVLNVYFTRNEYTLTFRNSRYTIYGTITAKYQANIAAQWPVPGQKMNGGTTAVPSNLKCWNFKNANGEDVIQASKIFNMTADLCKSGGITFTAKTENDLTTYQVNYWLESLDGTGTQVGRVTYQKSDLYSQSAKYGKISGWLYKELDGFTHDGRDEAEKESNNTFNLYYERVRHDITFYDNHGTQVAAVSGVMFEMPLKNVTYKDKAISQIVPEYPADLEAGAYEFGGWYTTAGCYPGTEADFDNDIMPNANLAFYAKWVPVTHTVNTYKDYQDDALVDLIDTQKVAHGSFAVEPEQPVNGNYTFVGWFYQDNGVEKAFDFASMTVRKDLDIYAKWSSNVLVEYTVQYQLEDGTTIADPTTGYALAGTTKTFDAKVENQLYEGYRQGYFPVVRSHSLTMDIEGGNVFTFVYKPVQNVPYKVQYLDAETGLPVAQEKVVQDNQYAVVTENAVTVKGYLPDAFQKRLILEVPNEGEPTADDNVLIFWYTKDEEHAIVSTTHYLVDNGVTTQYQHTEETGIIGNTYTRNALTISGYKLDRVTVNGDEWMEDVDPSAVLTGDGLHFEFYYSPNYFYVYHSSNQSVESIIVPEDGTFDITELVKDGYLYGGYYSAYKKAGSYAGGPNATHNGSDYKGAIAGYWDKSAAYTENGRAMKPEAGKTYYLKEVPEQYFRPTMALVYDSYANPNTAEGLYLISATDDKNYSDFGLEVVSSIVENGYNQEKSYAVSFKFQHDLGSGSTTTVTAKSAFGVPAGYLGVWNATEELVADNSFTYRPYVVTPDGVTVYGTVTRTVYTGDVTYRGTLDNGPGVHRVDTENLKIR